MSRRDELSKWPWLADHLGYEYFDQVVGVHFGRNPSGRFSPNGLEALADLPHLQEVGVFKLAVNDSDLEKLAELKHLQILYISGSRFITDQGVRHLERLSCLKKLELSDVHVTDKSVPSLRTLRKLQWLQLNGTGITAAGLTELQEKLPSCKIISQL